MTDSYCSRFFRAFIVIYNPCFYIMEQPNFFCVLKTMLKIKRGKPSLMVSGEKVRILKEKVLVSRDGKYFLKFLLVLHHHMY